MRKTVRFVGRAASVAATAVLLVACATTAPTGPMGFFITSAGPGNGADLGGLAGADAHCQKLASTAGAGARTWRAYLSTGWTSTTPVVNARDRIGKGPWFNAKGVQIASDVDNLHSANNLTKTSALDEKGEMVNGRGDTPNRHDILTGSRADGTAFSSAPGMPEMTCGEWKKSGDGSAMTGHHDRIGLATDAWSTSWNSSHNTVGCSQQALTKTGGAGLFYCFAAD
ncbi:MAG: hypothetical protein IPH54_21015 [Rhodoferax sp.]|jgi:hypothetical protein|nr:hypothetical protein [Rhodoferax sp.]